MRAGLRQKFPVVILGRDAAVRPVVPLNGTPGRPQGRRGEEEDEVEKKDEKAGEEDARFFWWRTACNTWQYLVSVPRTVPPAGSAVCFPLCTVAAIRHRGAEGVTATSPCSLSFSLPPLPLCLSP